MAKDDSEAGLVKNDILDWDSIFMKKDLVIFIIQYECILALFQSVL